MNTFNKSNVDRAVDTAKKPVAGVKKKADKIKVNSEETAEALKDSTEVVIEKVSGNNIKHKDKIKKMKE